jgi:23S rRNA pseudouridine1911/1915/1917 synthase
MPTNPSTVWTVLEEDVGIRLDKYLAATARLGSRRRVSVALERGQVWLNDKEASLADAGARLARGDVVRLWMDRPGSATRRQRHVDIGDLRILYEDEALVVVDKPAGLLVVPLARRSGAESVYGLLAARMALRGGRRPIVVHRIDRDTSGLVCFGRNERAGERLKEQFRQLLPERIYWAVVYGHPQPAAGEWRNRVAWDRHAHVQRASDLSDPHGTDALSEYRVLERFKDASLLEVRLMTGKRNQIRLQAQLRGHPLVGERQYAPQQQPSAQVVFPRQALHAYRLAFRHPIDDRLLKFEAPLAPDLVELLTRLRRK